MLNENMKANINAYGGRIETIDDFVKVVRKMPGMYLGGIGNKCFLNMIREIAQNAIDQLLDPSSPCDHVDLIYDERSLVTIVRDNGLGIPFDGIVRIFTKQNTSKNYNKKKGEYSSGMHGVGAKVTNALSDWFTVESYKYDGEARRLELVDGHPKGEVKKIPNKEKLQGTVVSFHPELDVIGHDIDLPFEEVLHLFKLIMSLTPLGSVMNFTGVSKSGKTYTEKIVNKDGIITDLIIKTKKPLCAPIVYSEDTGEMRCDFAMVFDLEALGDGTDVTAFCNVCPTTTGTHIDGFVNGVCRWFQQYMNKIYLGSNSKIQVKFDDIKVGLNAMISAYHLEPLFDGQAKNVLTNSEMKPFCADVAFKGLEVWSKNNPADLKKICEYIKKQAQLRTQMENGKAKIAKSYSVSVFSGLPDKYTKPTEKRKELWIVEGDSANGSAKGARHNATQGIFPVRGKIINAMAKPTSAVLANNEAVGIFDIVGGGEHGKNYGRYFDIDKVLWEMIISGVDADPDGSHINSLLLRLFIVYMPTILERGMYYKAVAPLYSIMQGEKYKYFIDRLDMLKHYQKVFMKKNVVLDATGKQLTGMKLTEILMEFADYVYEVNKLADTYKLDPELLELTLIMYNEGKKAPAIAKEANKNPKYAFVKSGKKYGIEMVHGLVGIKYNTIYLNEKFIKESANVLKYMQDRARLVYVMNNQKVTIYRLMVEFDKLMDSTLDRLKGLGEMDPDQLRESVMDPFGGNRTLIRYTLEDAKAEIDTIRSYESDRSKILDHIGEISRLDVMD